MKYFLLFAMITLSGCENDKSLFSSGVGGGSSSAGSTCQPKVTCQSIGAECGKILDDGCGHSIDCGNNCIAPMTCGGGNLQFKCGCTPKSCLEQGKECGVSNDTCGGLVDCEYDCSANHICNKDNKCECVPKKECSTDGCGSNNPINCECGTISDNCGGTIGCTNNICGDFVKCGGSRFDADGNQIPSNPNICGDGCKKIGLDPIICTKENFVHTWWCPGHIYPTYYNSNSSGCDFVSNSKYEYIDGVFGRYWCCLK